MDQALYQLLSAVSALSIACLLISFVAEYSGAVYYVSLKRHRNSKLAASQRTSNTERVFKQNSAPPDVVSASRTVCFLFIDVKFSCRGHVSI